LTAVGLVLPAALVRHESVGSELLRPDDLLSLPNPAIPRRISPRFGPASSRFVAPQRPIRPPPPPSPTSGGHLHVLSGILRPTRRISIAPPSRPSCYATPSINLTFFHSFIHSFIHHHHSSFPPKSDAFDCASPNSSLFRRIKLPPSTRERGKKKEGKSRALLPGFFCRFFRAQARKIRQVHLIL